MTRDKYFLFSSTILIVLISILIFGVSFKEYIIFPNDKKDLKIDAYKENFSFKASSSIITFNNDKICFNYSLTSHEKFPYTGVYIRNKDKSKSILNVNDYNAVSIQLKAKKAKRIPIILKFIYQPEVKDKSHYIPYSYIINYKGEKTYKISLNEFELESWWMRRFNVNESEEPLKNYNELEYFLIESCRAISMETYDEITIGKIKFYNDNSVLYIWVGLIAILSSIGLLLHYKLTHNRVLVPINHIKISSKRDFKGNPLNQVKLYISSNYSNPKLSKSDLQEALKMSSKEFNEIFKDKLNTTFKSYLNLIRITEVKHLLKTTDHSISEIAFKCGYNQVPHFNRVFKKETGLSPKEYREKNKY